MPLAFLPENHVVALAIMSYNGAVDFGLLGDYDAMPDLEALGGMIEEARDELLTEAARRTAAGNGAGANSRGRTSRPRTSSRASTEA